ncbi:MAG: hypothetical protein R2854_04365 [Caldilineaceae bacterium]
MQQLSGVAGRQHHLIVSQGPQRLGSQLLSYYRFVHILFQDYLYGLLDAAERVYLHEAVGNAWETLAAGRTDAVAIQLARHFQAAELPDKAITYLHVAGRQAMALSAHHQAIAHLTDALALLPARNGTQARDEHELQLLTDLGICYKITKGFAMPGVEEVYRRAQELCETAGDALSRACVLWGLHSVYIVRGELVAAYKPAQECLALAGDESLLHVTANSMLGCAHSHMGDVRTARPFRASVRRLSGGPAPHVHFLGGTRPGCLHPCPPGSCLVLSRPSGPGAGDRTRGSGPGTVAGTSVQPGRSLELPDHAPPVAR